MASGGLFLGNKEFPLQARTTYTHENLILNVQAAHQALGAITS
jgi:hypothetical protein